MTTLPPPDRAHGLFETLLVLDGEPVELDAHLDRLAASLATVFGVERPAGLAGEATDQAGDLALGRMRIDVTPGQVTALRTEMVDPADFFPEPGRGARLRSLRCDGGLGPHKWADRRPLAETGEGAVALLLDGGHEVLEAGRANVFAAIDGVLVTPMADGRILPGIARAGAIAAAGEAGIEVAERPLALAELRAANEVFLTGSVRGVEPASSLDGTTLPPTGEISRRVGDRLRRRWLAPPVATAAPAPAAVPPRDRLVR